MKKKWITENSSPYWAFGMAAIVAAIIIIKCISMEMGI